MTITLSRRSLLIIGLLGVFAAGIGVGLLLGGGEDVEPAASAVISETADETDGAESADRQPESESASNTGLPDCDEAGISSGPRREGVCEIEGSKAIVVNEGSTLKLRELEVDLLGIQKEKTVSDEYGTAKSAGGTYVIFKLEVRNRTNVPVYFDSNQSQAYLYINGNIYTQDFDVENYALDDSFVNQFEEIQPKGTQTGTIAFDVPNSVLSGLERTGNLNIVNFSEENQGLNAEEIGTIRTYQ